MCETLYTNGDLFEESIKEEDKEKVNKEVDRVVSISNGEMNDEEVDTEKFSCTSKLYLKERVLNF